MRPQLISDPVQAAYRVGDLSAGELDRLQAAWSEIEQVAEQLQADLTQFDALRVTEDRC